MGKDEKANAKPQNAVPATESNANAAPEQPASSAAKPKKQRLTKTLGDLAADFIRHLETEGKSHGTCFSYSMELRAACKELGEKTKLASLTPKKVAGFFECDRVMKLKSGEPKSQLSIDKSRRVLRLALVWAVGQGWIENAPLPAGTKPAKSK